MWSFDISKGPNLNAALLSVDGFIQIWCQERIVLAYVKLVLMALCGKKGNVLEVYWMEITPYTVSKQNLIQKKLKMWSKKTKMPVEKFYCDAVMIIVAVMATAAYIVRNISPFLSSSAQ